MLRASPFEWCRTILGVPSLTTREQGSAEKRHQSSQITWVSGSIPSMPGTPNEPKLFWLSRGIEQRFAECGWSGWVGTPRYNYEASGGNVRDDVQRAEDRSIETGPGVGEPRRPNSERTSAGVLRAILRLGVSERARKNEGAYTLVARGDLNQSVASGREAERADPAGFDVVAGSEEIEGSEKRRALGRPELDVAFALSLSRPIEHQYAESTRRECARFVQHAGPVGLRPMTQDDGSAVARGDVPPSDPVSVQAPEADIVEAQRGRVSRDVHRPASAGKRVAFRSIGPDGPRDGDRAGGNKGDYQNDGQQLQVEKRVEGRADLREDADIALLLIPAAQACKVPVRVSSTFVPAAIALTILDIRQRGIAASARSVTLHSGIVSRDGDARTVSIVLPAKLNSAAQRRLATFAAGRYCGTCAAEDVTGLRAFELPIGESGAPVWPVGLTGSISHTDSLAIAAVARGAGVAGIGIDYEPVVSHEVADEIEKLVFADRREAQVGRGLEFGMSWPQLATLTFSAKESLYKALRPLVGRFFEFHDARLIELTPAHATLRLEVDLGGPFRAGRSFAVRYSLADGCVATAVAIPSACQNIPSASQTTRSSFQ